MPYTSLALLRRRFSDTLLVQLTDRGEQATGSIDGAIVDQAIADTGAVIDASLAVRYRLPLVSVPPMVADLALTIAIYKLHVHRPGEKIERDYEQALRDLDKLASGAKRLELAGIEPDTSGAGGVVASDRPRDLTPDNLRGFI